MDNLEWTVDLPDDVKGVRAVLSKEGQPDIQFDLIRASAVDFVIVENGKPVSFYYCTLAPPKPGAPGLVTADTHLSISDAFKGALAKQYPGYTPKEIKAVSEADILEKIAELENRFRESTGVSFVHGELRLEQHRIRFYLGEGSPSSPPRSWRHILELATDEVLKCDASEILGRLEAAKWLEGLKASPCKVFVFEGGKLSIDGDCP